MPLKQRMNFFIYIYIYIYIYNLHTAMSLLTIFFFLFIPYILVDASGWVVSDVSGGVSGLSTSDPPHPNDPVGIDLTE